MRRNRHRISRALFCAILFVVARPARAQDPVAQVASTVPGSTTAIDTTAAASLPPASTPKPARQAGAEPHKLGPFQFTVNWRFRSEAWDWFEAAVPAQNSYAFEHSLLRIGLGQKTERFEWFIEGAEDAIVSLPAAAVLPGAPGQLGLGGTYYVANGNGQNNTNAFVRQAYFDLALPSNSKLRLGRFTFLDGAEAIPKDKSLATIVNTRISQRLIGDFGFSAVGRSYDGAQLTFDSKAGNFTFLGARPTRGVYQIDAMGELKIDLFYGAYTLSIGRGNSAGQFRLFGVGYVDERSSVPKTDNRVTPLRSADHDPIRIGTYGANYVHVFNTLNHGKFDFLLWGAVQNGCWGVLTQRSAAFAGEAGWQPVIGNVNPWFRLGYSYGSGDSDPADGRHGTFFQVLPTPRPYARFPFYNMMNNEDFFASSVFRLPHSLVLRSELHALRLADAADLWYGGGGAFAPRTFGYTGRATGGNRSLANVWDLGMDVPLRYGFSLTTYYAHAWGKGAVAAIYPTGANAQFGYVETNFRF
jgi:Alginate export